MKSRFELTTPLSYETIERAIFSARGERLLGSILLTLGNTPLDRPSRIKATPAYRTLKLWTGMHPINHAVAKHIAAWRNPNEKTTDHVGVALMELLSRYKKGGAIDNQRFVKKFGAEGEVLLYDIARLGEQVVPSDGGWQRRRDLYRATKPHRMSTTPPKEIAAFRSIVRKYAKGAPLKGVRVLALQHLIGTTSDLVDGLVAAGVDPTSVTMMGKAYSQHLGTVNDLRARGVTALELTPSETPSENVAREIAIMDAGIEQHMLALKASPDERLLLIDDGGKLIRRIHEKWPDLASRVVSVEQTQRGIAELASIRLMSPVVNVAESWAKKSYESPIIGQCVGRAVISKLTELKWKSVVDKPRRVLVVGYGAVGRATAQYLKTKGYLVEMYDPKQAARDNAVEDQVHVHDTLKAGLAEADLVISATGGSGPSMEALTDAKDGVILFNAASGSDEFDAGIRAWTQKSGKRMMTSRMESTFRGRPFYSGDALDPARRDTVLTAPSGKQLLLASNGYVINFTGVRDPTPPRYIQLTRGLLFLAALQAVSSKGTGLQALDLAKQEELVNAVQKQLAKRGDSLLNPRDDTWEAPPPLDIHVADVVQH